MVSKSPKWGYPTYILHTYIYIYIQTCIHNVGKNNKNRPFVNGSNPIYIFMVMTEGWLFCHCLTHILWVFSHVITPVTRRQAPKEPKKNAKTQSSKHDTSSTEASSESSLWGLRCSGFPKAWRVQLRGPLVNGRSSGS